MSRLVRLACSGVLARPEHSVLRLHSLVHVMMCPKREVQVGLCRLRFVGQPVRISFVSELSPSSCSHPHMSAFDPLAESSVEFTDTVSSSHPRDLTHSQSAQVSALTLTRLLGLPLPTPPGETSPLPLWFLSRENFHSSCGSSSRSSVNSIQTPRCQSGDLRRWRSPLASVAGSMCLGTISCTRPRRTRSSAGGTTTCA